MQNNRILSGLGLAQKAGCIASGEFAVEKAVKGGLACVVLYGSDPAAGLCQICHEAVR